MKKKLLHIATVAALLSFPMVNSAQAPTLGAAANFVLFTGVGAVTQTGISHLTGNVGSNSGSSTGFGNVDGVMNDQNGASALASTNLITAYNQLNTTIATIFPAPAFGNATLTAGVYSVSAAATLNSSLTLDGQNNANAVFIFQIGGSFSTGAGSQIVLINGAKACNVFWKIDGLVSMAAGTKMRGTVIANNAGIVIGAGCTLEGRALSTNGAIGVTSLFAYTPIGCGSPFLTGPASPTLASTACYALFTSNGPATNVGNTKLVGDVGTNVGLTTGYNPLLVTGMIHPIPDGSTGACAADLLNVYTYLNTLPYDIELLYPAQFGKSLVLTPHSYVMNSAVTFIDTLFLNGQGNANAVFVIKVNGAFNTGTYANVVLTNGTQAKNVFWKIDGALNINNFSNFKGTMIVNNGAINLNKGMSLIGRALSTNGALSTDSVKVNIPGLSLMASSSATTLCSGKNATLSASGANNYTWNPGGTGSVIVVTPTTNTTYTLTGSQATCIGGTSTISIVVNQSPTVTTVTNFSVLCTGHVAVLTATGATTYTWNTNAVTSNITISPTVTTTYTVIGTSGSCSSTSTITQVVSPCTGIDQNNGIATEIVIYPNPNNGQFTIQFNSISENTSVEIYNSIGQLVSKERVTSTSLSIDLHDLATGIYQIRILENNSMIKQAKVIIH
ncbi:MAG: ice-binding family protein [Bacteroidota bacterium]|nr:ice-binding family protein [Bacteroidota bacterium]